MLLPVRAILERVVVTGGIEANEEVIIRGQSVVSDGDQVIIDYNYVQLDEFGVPVAALEAAASVPEDQG